MVALPQLNCPTLERADEELVRSQDKSTRQYLGMSAIGARCPRQLWYRYRWALKPSFDALSLKRFADGHATEAVVVARLKAVDELEVYDVGEDGEQFGFKDLGGHFSGHMDGVILGLKQAPKTWHVLEVKATNEKKFAELKKIKTTLGEKLALREWNEVYYAQAVLYMDYAGLDRHYTVVSTPGGRDWISLRTNADPAEALRLKMLAERIVFSDTPPDRIGNGPGFFLCGPKWCEFTDICHHGALPERNCRTCLHSTVQRAGGWTCDVDISIPIDGGRQAIGCGAQRFLPGFVTGEQVDVDNRGAISYRCKDGGIWVDGGPA